MLAAGSRIAVVAPAGIHDPEGLARGRRLVEEWGYQTVEAPHLSATFRYTAGTFAQRREGLLWALTAPDLQGVWFARGGYGTAGLLGSLPWSDLDDRVIIGFSDATALLVSAWSRCRLRPVHGPVLHSLADLPDGASRAALRRVLERGGPVFLPGQHLAGPRHEVRGPVVGGNLSVLASLAGTHWQPSFSGAVLLLEDVAEAPYRVDRLLWQLRASGMLDGVLGLALGQFVRCDAPPAAGWNLVEVLADLLGSLGVPVVADLPVGHGTANHAFAVGQPATLTPEGLACEAATPR